MTNFIVTNNSAPKSDNDRNAILENPGFGKHFTDHMVLIDWEKDVYLVEGVFDGFFLPNSIPMLGKHMSELLFNTLYDKVKKNIIIALDGDAWDNALKLYRELNGGKLYGKIKIVHLPSSQIVMI